MLPSNARQSTLEEARSEICSHFKMETTAADALLVKRLVPGATLPSCASPGDAGYDLSAAADQGIEAGGWGLVRTGIAIAFPEGTYGRVAPRSGLAIKKGIAVGAGVVDR